MVVFVFLVHKPPQAHGEANASQVSVVVLVSLVLWAGALSCGGVRVFPHMLVQVVVLDDGCSLK